jgi:hypothetical protein
MTQNIYHQLLEDAFEALEEYFLNHSEIAIKEIDKNKIIQVSNMDELIKEAIRMTRKRVFEMEDEIDGAFMKSTIATTVAMELLKDPVLIVLKQLIIENIIEGDTKHVA